MALELIPILTIAAGFVVGLVLFGIELLYNVQFKGISFQTVQSLLFVISGLITTYFAKERKMRYGIYVGICYSIITILTYLLSMTAHLNYHNLYNFLFLVLLFTGIGGFIGKITDKNQLYTGFRPIYAIISGFLVALLCNNLLWSITGIITNYAHYSFGIINVVCSDFFGDWSFFDYIFGQRKRNTIWNLFRANFNTILDIIWNIFGYSKS